MEEFRGYYRIKNQQAIKAKYQNEIFLISDISGSGVKVISKNSIFSDKGYIEILVNYCSKTIKIEFFSLNMEYKVLRKEDQSVILIFVNESQITELASLIKKISSDKSLLSQTYY